MEIGHRVRSSFSFLQNLFFATTYGRSSSQELKKNMAHLYRLRSMRPFTSNCRLFIFSFKVYRYGGSPQNRQHYCVELVRAISYHSLALHVLFFLIVGYRGKVSKAPRKVRSTALYIYIYPYKHASSRLKRPLFLPLLDKRFFRTKLTRTATPEICRFMSLVLTVCRVLRWYFTFNKFILFILYLKTLISLFLAREGDTAYFIHAISRHSLTLTREGRDIYFVYTIVQGACAMIYTRACNQLQLALLLPALSYGATLLVSTRKKFSSPPECSEERDYASDVGVRHPANPRGGRPPPPPLAPPG